VALLLTHGTMNLMSLIGVIMLMGLVAKNAILLLDATRQEERAGVEREEALMHAGRKRLRPILMTTFALVAGMMPVAIGVGEGGEFYRPMAVAIIGGTITSTLLTLLVVPCFYDSVQLFWSDIGALFRHVSGRFGAVVGGLAVVGRVLLQVVGLIIAINLSIPILLVLFVVDIARWVRARRARTRGGVRAIVQDSAA
jgi:HAE1 family hydrophobic/amphiphilic exporter-1